MSLKTRLGRLADRILHLAQMATGLLVAKAADYHWLVYPALAFLVTRLIVLGAGFVGDIMLPTDPGHWTPVPERPFLSLWARWDSQWYNWIIREGYWLNPQERSNVAFFPLYPLLVKVLMPLVRNNAIMAGIVVSNAAFLAALVFLYRLADFEFGSRATAQRTVYYLALFPTSFFFSAMYTESLYILLSIATFYFARRHLWAWAALTGLLCSATRFVGVLTWGVVMWEWLRVHGWTLATAHCRLAWRHLWDGLKRDWGQVLVIALIPIGLISYMLFLRMSFRDPLAFLTVQSAWARQQTGPWAVVARDVGYLLDQGFNQGNLSRLLNVSTVVAVVTISPFVWQRLGAGYAIYTLLMVLIPASSATQSIIRYVLTAFPVFMILGEWGRRPYFDRVTIALFAALLGVLTAVFVNWVFVA